MIPDLRIFTSTVVLCALLGCAHRTNKSEPMQSTFKEQSIPFLINGVPDILKSQDKKTGRFGDGIWIVTDQNAFYPLAVAWSLNRPDNPYYHSPEVLQA